MTALATMKSKMLATLAAAALAVCILPATAFAATINVYNGGDSTASNLVGSIVTDGDNANVTLSSGTVNALYNKSGWQKLTGTQYVTVETALDAVASSAWDDCDYITFDTQETTGVAPYQKYNSGHFTKEEVTTNYYYYPSIGSASISPLPTTGQVPNKMAFAFNWGTASIASNATADTTSVTTAAHTYPRLIWGLSGATPDSAAGNRLPSNIVAIHLMQED